MLNVWIDNPYSIITFVYLKPIFINDFIVNVIDTFRNKFELCKCLFSNTRFYFNFNLTKEVH